MLIWGLVKLNLDMAGFKVKVILDEAKNKVLRIRIWAFENGDEFLNSYNFLLISSTSDKPEIFSSAYYAETNSCRAST